MTSKAITFGRWLAEQSPRGDNVGEISRWLFRGEGTAFVVEAASDVLYLPLADWHALVTRCQLEYRDPGAFRRLSLGVALNRAWGEHRMALNGQDPIPEDLWSDHE